jgi:hypothetical protein
MMGSPLSSPLSSVAAATMMVSPLSPVAAATMMVSPLSPVAAATMMVSPLSLPLSSPLLSPLSSVAAATMQRLGDEARSCGGNRRCERRTPPVRQPSASTSEPSRAQRRRRERTTWMSLALMMRDLCRDGYGGRSERKAGQTATAGSNNKHPQQRSSTTEAALNKT